MYLLTNGCLAALDLSWMDIGLESCFMPRYTSFPSGNATILSAMELHLWCDTIQGVVYTRVECKDVVLLVE